MADEMKEIIQAAVRVLVEPILRLLQQDPHQWSVRPCETCRTISSLVGQPFGCQEYRRQQQETKL